MDLIDVSVSEREIKVARSRKFCDSKVESIV